MAFGRVPVKYSDFVLSEGSSPSLNARAFNVEGSSIVIGDSYWAEVGVGSVPSKVNRMIAPSVSLDIPTVTGTRPFGGSNFGASAIGGIQSCST